MRFLKIIFGATFSIGLFVSQLPAAQESIATLPVLKESPSPRISGMGRIAIAYSQSDPFIGIYNPAGVAAFTNNYHVRTGYSHYQKELTLSAIAFHIGKSYKKLNFGIAFYNMALQEGTKWLYSIDNVKSKKIIPGESVQMFALGIGFKQWLEIGAGISFKSFSATPLVVYEFMQYQLTGHARDWGFFCRIPFHELIKWEMLEKFPVAFSAESLFGYSYRNAGSAEKNHQDYYLIGENSLNTASSLGIILKYHNIRFPMIKITLALEGFNEHAMNVKSLEDKAYDYFKVPRDIYCQRPVDHKKGFELRLADFFSYRYGKIYEGHNNMETTSGWGIHYSGIKRVLHIYELGKVQNRKWDFLNRIDWHLDFYRFHHGAINWMITVEY